MIASNIASSSANDVSIRQASSGRADRTSRHTSTPVPSGSWTSSTATSGLGERDPIERLRRRCRPHPRPRCRPRLRAGRGPPPDDLVVVEQEHADRHRDHSCRPPRAPDGRPLRLRTIGREYRGLRRAAPAPSAARRGAGGGLGPRPGGHASADHRGGRPARRVRTTARSACWTRRGRGWREFITVGIDDEVRAEIGELPKGHGILGTLITDPRPLRLPGPA